MEKKYMTDKGVEVYAYKNPSLHGFLISLFVRAGSMFETPENNGITHFFEHVAIRNVNKLMDGDLYSELDRLGVEFNASTYYEMVQFYVSGASDSFAFGADALCRILSPIVLTRSEIDSERKRIKAEIREGNDKSSLVNFSSGIVHEGTSLALPITGSVTSVNNITLARLEEHRKSITVKENIFFYVTGSFTDEDISTLFECIDKHDIGSGKRNENMAPVPHNFLKRDASIAVKSSDYAMVRFTFDLDMSLLSVPETDLIYDILLSGYNSRFFIEMSEVRGLFYDLGGSVEHYRNLGELYFSYELRERDIYEAVRLTVDILKDLKSTLLDERNCMKRGYVDNAYMLLDDSRELGFTMAYDNHIMELGYDGIDSRIEAYRGVTPEHIRAAACRIFRSENLTLTLKGNKKKIDTEKLKQIIRTLDY